MFASIKNTFARVPSFIARPRLSRAAFLVAGIALLAASASANPNVTFSVRDFLSRDFTNKSITITPIGGPFIDGTNVVSGQSYTTNTGNGVFVISNMVSGTYRVNLFGNPATAWQMTVPNDNNDYPASALVVVNPPGFTTIQNALLSAQYVRHTNGNLVGPTNFFRSNLVAGSGVTLTYDASGKPTIAASGGGGGVTTNELLSVSNSIPLLVGGVTLVSTNGNDSTAQRTNWHKPYRTVGAAISNAVAGDTVLVSGGIYPESNIRWPSSNITLAGVGHQTVITSAVETASSLRVMFEMGPNSTIRNLTAIHRTADGYTFMAGPSLSNNVYGPLGTNRIENVKFFGESDIIALQNPSSGVSSQYRLIVNNSELHTRWDASYLGLSNSVVEFYNTQFRFTGPSPGGTGNPIRAALVVPEANQTNVFHDCVFQYVLTNSDPRYVIYTESTFPSNATSRTFLFNSVIVPGSGGPLFATTGTNHWVGVWNINTLDGSPLRFAGPGTQFITNPPANFQAIGIVSNITALPGSRYIGTGSNSIETITTLTASNITVIGGTLDLNADRVIGAYTNAGTNIGGVFTNVANLQVTNLNIASGGTLSGVIVGSGLSTLTNLTALASTNGLFSGTAFRQVQFSSSGVGIGSGQGTFINVFGTGSGGIDIGGGGVVTRLTGGGGFNVTGNLTNSGTGVFTNGVTIGRTNTYTAAEIPVGGGGIWVSNTAAGRPDAIFISVNGNGSVTNWLINVTKP